MTSTYVVTGANRGIGLELTRQLAARGEDVIATARNPASAKPLSALGVRTEALDVSDPESVRAFTERLRGVGVDVLINNAGIGVGSDALGKIDYEKMRTYFEINAFGALRVTEALLPSLRQGARKVVANMTSKMGSIADNTSGGAYAYRASKSALNMLTKSLALDLEPDGFCCVLLHPGWVQTDMGGAAAPLSVEDSARGLLELVDRLEPQQSGRFFDYSGAELPW